jgi:hypothetical protein
MSPEERLKGLSAEERVKGLTAEELARQLKANGHSSGPNKERRRTPRPFHISYAGRQVGCSVRAPAVSAAPPSC